MEGVDRREAAKSGKAVGQDQRKFLRGENTSSVF